jgi:oligopeptide transport system substrate-binding protein
MHISRQSLLRLLPLALAALLLAPACSRRESPVTIGNRDQVLHLGNLSEPADLDPHTVTGVPERNVISAILEGLVAEDPRTLAPVPGVAARWDVSPDGLVYTFHLRPDARWSDNAPVTATDFVFSFQRILSPRLGAPYAYMLYCLRGAEDFHKGRHGDFTQVGVRALDPLTLELTLTYPIPHFLTLLNHHTWLPVHAPTLAKFGPPDQIGTPWTQPQHFIGNGPFVLDSWEPGERIIVRRSDTYWDRASVRLRAIQFHAIGDHNIEERAFRSGQLHVTGTVPIDRIDYYRTKHPELLHIEPYLGCYYYLFNVRRPPLDDARVRRALALAVDRDQLVRFVTRAGETPALHFTPPDTAGYTARARLKADIADAQRLLADAGFPGGQNFPRVELLYNTSDAHARIAQALQQMWKTRLGIDITLVNMEWKVYINQTQNGQYDMARASWIADYEDPNTFLDLWVSGGGNNRTGWANTNYDRLIADAARTRDHAARLENFQQAEELLIQEMPILPLYFYRSKSLVQPSVRGWHPNRLDHHPYKAVYLDSAP